MPSKTFTVRGHKVRSQSQRRFIVFAVRPEPITIRPEDEAARIFGRTPGTYPAFVETVRRSDSIARAERIRQSQVGKWGVGTAVVIVDSTTGEEVSA